jgi:hypothetical protein
LPVPRGAGMARVSRDNKKTIKHGPVQKPFQNDMVLIKMTNISLDPIGKYSKK